MRNLGVKQVAEKLGKAKSTVANYVTEGKFPKPKKNGLSTYWNENVVDAWIILTSGEQATLPAISVSDLREIETCIETINNDQKETT